MPTDTNKDFLRILKKSTIETEYAYNNYDMDLLRNISWHLVVVHTILIYMTPS